MYIGETAQKTGLSIKAIRFYEKIGLIQEPAREGRYRVYGDLDVELLILIREAKELGIPLSKLKGVIDYEGGEVNWTKVKHFLSEIREDFVRQIADLNKKIELIDSCYEQINA